MGVVRLIKNGVGVGYFQESDITHDPDNQDREDTQQSPISPSKGAACTEDSKWRPAARVCLIHPIKNFVILSWMKISVFRCISLTKIERELCVKEVYLLHLHRVTLS